MTSLKMAHGIYRYLRVRYYFHHSIIRVLLISLMVAGLPVMTSTAVFVSSSHEQKLMYKSPPNFSSYFTSMLSPASRVEFRILIKYNSFHSCLDNISTILRRRARWNIPKFLFLNFHLRNTYTSNLPHLKIKQKHYKLTKFSVISLKSTCAKS